jgi:hypothetical protein
MEASHDLAGVHITHYIDHFYTSYNW